MFLSSMAKKLTSGDSAMEFSDEFLYGFNGTMTHEGKTLSNDKNDPGQQTYWGISRARHPSWKGWSLIDSGELPLENMIKEFYKIRFWDELRGDEIAKISKEVAAELFDTAVNIGIRRAVEFFQTALNMQNNYGKTYPDLEVDGILGSKTIECLSRYASMQPGNKEDNINILLRCMNGEQYIFYKKNPKHEYFRGWFRRV